MRVMTSVAVFVVGAVLLCAEFVGQRMLAVRWGDSLEVWAADIAVVLGGLAVGYAAGGRLADRWPRRETLAATMVAGACSLAVAGLAGDVVLAWVAELLPGVRSGALVGAVLLLGPPTVLLSTATPLAARLHVESLQRLGRGAGDVYALGTVGSIVGALATAFWGFALLSLPALFTGCCALVLLSAAAVAWPRRKVALPVAALGLCMAALAGAVNVRDLQQGAVGVVRFSAESPYHRVSVVDQGDQRRLALNGVTQSLMSLSAPDVPQYPYLQGAQRVWCATGPAAPKRMLLIGTGAGSAVRAARQVNPRMAVDAVDIDPVVTRVAPRWFGAPTGEGLRYVTEDGRRFVRRAAGGRYGTVMLDAYSGERLPAHLVTREFFTDVKRVLAADGVVVVNLVSRPDARLLPAVARTLQAVWTHVEVRAGSLGEDGDSGERNVLLYAASRPLEPSRPCLAGVERDLGLPRGRLAAFGAMAVPNAERVLTDAYAPVDALR